MFENPSKSLPLGQSGMQGDWFKSHACTYLDQ